MTINVTVLAPTFVVQGSDRCISAHGVPVGELNKAVSFVSERLRLCATFTGLAEFPDGQSTEMWLSQSLSSQELIHATVEEVADHMRDACDTRFGVLSRDWRIPTLITIAGWDVSDRPRHVVTYVGDCIDEHGRRIAPSKGFTSRRGDSGRRVHFAGTLPNEHKLEARLLDRMARLNRPHERMVDEVTRVIRVTAEQSELVGNDPVVVVMPIDGEALGFYCPPDDRLVSYGPAVVTCTDRVVMCIASPMVVYGSADMADEFGDTLYGDMDGGGAVRASRRIPVK